MYGSVTALRASTFLPNVDLHPNGPGHSVKGVESWVASAALNVGHIRLIEPSRLSDGVLGHLEGSARFCNLAAQAEMSSQGFKLRDSGGAFGSRLGLDLPHEVFELGTHAEHVMAYMA